MKRELDKYEKIGNELIKQDMLDALETLRSVLTLKEALAISKRIGERMKKI